MGKSFFFFRLFKDNCVCVCVRWREGADVKKVTMMSRYEEIGSAKEEERK